MSWGGAGEQPAPLVAITHLQGLHMRASPLLLCPPVTEIWGGCKDFIEVLTSCVGKGPAPCLPGERGGGKAGSVTVVPCLSFPTCEMPQMSQCEGLLQKPLLIASRGV